MRKTLAYSLMLAATLGLAACDKKSEDKAQDAAEHRQEAQEKMDSAQEKMNDAAKENAKANEAAAESNKAAAQEATKSDSSMPVAPGTTPATQVPPAKN
ncbi:MULTISPECIES: hypothetical protein [Pseudomonas]|jgi:peptidoglycan hydrolase CwlO-like protein|uniref:Lipoprotein n=1 Tax=Pseudomonas coleopterorum TaxID=1605838 RepID=A0AAJ6LXA8_9PSED|nr:MULTISPECIES: hypothetical protein [Pseudomonas]KTC38641.1 hypothetical protein AO269_06270 [Pseudomonas putida]RZA26107.1 MAG: hypothetical protein EOP02_11555 [Pseudomonadota bacterium]KNC12824.1 lipoprotein [Pseudomonas sp. RIT-PI-a]KQQ64015.1 hypothetical protein ASF66_06780 [Pseudomonas sp. Leaf129]MBD8480614.1 hypothetical protein [Pseudomonas coleopterorum]